MTTFLHESFAWPADRLLNRAKEADGKHEECADKFEGSSDNDSDEAEGKKDEPDERIEEKRREGEGPTDDHEDQKEQKVEHRYFSPHEINVGGGVKVPLGG
jgi:hypothetical protein